MPAPSTPISRPDCAMTARAPLVGTVEAPVFVDEAVAMTTEVEVLLVVGTMTVVLGYAVGPVETVELERGYDHTDEELDDEDDVVEVRPGQLVMVGLHCVMVRV